MAVKLYVKPLTFCKLHFLKSLIKHYFDREWYLTQNADVARAGIDPIEHYLTQGAFEGRDPNPLFDSDWYLEQNPDVKAARLNPLVHYLRWGLAEGRNPHPLFDSNWYLEQNPDVKAAGLNPLAHYLHQGVLEGRDPSQAEKDRQLKIRIHNLGLDINLDPTITVVMGIVTYNNSEVEIQRITLSSITALEQAGLKDTCKVFIIDNGLNSYEYLPNDSKIRHFITHGNIGFGASHNILMDAAFKEGADIYILANPDGAFHPQAISALVRMAQANKFNSLIEAIQFPEEHPKIYDFSTFDTPWASGACLLVPKEIYEGIGGFDETFFMYCEDVDFSWRARLAGYSVKICPRALFFHHVTNRAFDPEIHTMYLTSGLKLARKWESFHFEEKILAEFRRHHLEIPDVKVEHKMSDAKNIVDFENMFSFAPVRW